jgi:hypothetical protein
MQSFVEGGFQMQAASITSNQNVILTDKKIVLSIIFYFINVLVESNSCVEMARCSYLSSA